MARTSLLVATPVRLALVAVAVVLALLALLIGWTYSETNSVLARQVARAISTDLVNLSEEFDRGGRAGLLAAMEERRQSDKDAIYLLVANAGRDLISGNIAFDPTEHEGRGDGYVFAYRRSPTAIGPERLAAAAQRSLK